MKTLLPVVLGLILFCTVGCPGDEESNSSGVTGGAADGRPAPSPSPIASPIARLSVDLVTRVHAELLAMQQHGGTALDKWRHISGAKLYVALNDNATVSEKDLDTPLGDRLFNLLLDRLQDPDGTVKAEIDAKVIVQQLLIEYYKFSQGEQNATSAYPVRSGCTDSGLGHADAVQPLRDR